MKLKLLNGTYTEVDKVNAYTTLNERAYAGYSQCDPLDLYRYEVAVPGPYYIPTDRDRMDDIYGAEVCGCVSAERVRWYWNEQGPEWTSEHPDPFEFWREADEADIDEWGIDDAETRYCLRGCYDMDDLTYEKLNAVLIEIGEDAAEQEAERKEADTGMRYRTWVELVNDALDVPDAERLLAEIGGPTWIEAYTPDECVRICEAAVAVAGDGIRGLLAFLGTSQAAFADRYLIPRRSVENWCTRSEINHRDCPAYVVSLLSYAALRDAGII